jgi:hypothetical protein
MRLAIHSMFFEFVPFDDANFDSEGNIKPDAQALMIHEVEENKDYAILISTNAGAWRYLIGDTIRFVDKEHLEIIITGRTKHFLSLVGEHLSVDNMNRAIQLTSEELNISIPEFTVAGIPYQTFFAHQWYVACDDRIDAQLIRNTIDKHLRVLNDDYEVERNHALKEVFVTVLPEDFFLDFLRSKGKIGGQIKFPRVLKGKRLEEWKQFLIDRKVPGEVFAEA